MKKILLLLLFVPHIISATQSEIHTPMKGTVVIFAIPKKTMRLNALAERSLSKVIETFNQTGRLLPVESNKMISAYRKASETVRDDFKLFKKTAQRLKVDVYVIIDTYRRGRYLFSKMRILPLSQEYAKLKKTIVIRSRVAMNIPFKLGKEIAYLMKKQPILVKIKKILNKSVLLNIGQWNGIKKGIYFTKNQHKVDIKKCGVYYCRAQISKHLISKTKFFIPLYPNIEKILQQYNERIEFNILKRYGLENTLLRGQKPGKKLIEGICIINPGANVCVPGYGSFLSTGYLGFKPRRPDVMSMVFPYSIMTTQLLFVPSLTKFESHFFPWIKDSDKDKKTQNLQVFNWATIPLTMTVSYFDQLSYQFTRTEHLPPYFMNKNISAAAFSLFIPGSGLFLKGYRLLGWGYYSTELFLASYGIYNLDNKEKATYSFIALGIVKTIELLHAYFIKPSYRFYKIEKDESYDRTGFSFYIDKNEDKKEVYKLAINYNFF